MKLFPFFRREASHAEIVAAASRWIDQDRARRIAALNTPHSIAARKGWARRRETGL